MDEREGSGKRKGREFNFATYSYKNILEGKTGRVCPGSFLNDQAARRSFKMVGINCMDLCSLSVCTANDFFAFCLRFSLKLLLSIEETGFNARLLT